jgi:elongation factor 1-gamma
MSLKLVTYPALFRSQKVIITAELAKVSLEVDTNTTESQLAGLSVHGKVPCLVTPEGNISESNAIARYIARMASPSLGLLGASPFEAAQVDSWMDFCVQDLEIPATLWIAPILGWMDENKAVSERAAADLKKGMSLLENHLKMETFIVGRQITVADVAIATTLLLPLKLVLDAKAREAFPNVMRWFDLCVHQQAFVDVVGETKLCEVPLQAAAKATASSPVKAEKKKEEKPAKADKPKAEEKPKAEKKVEEKPKAAEKRKQEDELEPESYEEKKAKNPLDDLPKSPFVLDEWKRQYSNAPNGDCRKAMPFFWENYDKEGYSLWFQAYNFNSECKVVFMTSNLVGGFVQRSDSLRKYAFGVMQVTGTQQGQKIQGAWLIRGQDIKPMLTENDDAEYYTWTKLDQPPTDEQKAKIEELWCAEDKIDGEQILDCKVFK